MAWLTLKQASQNGPSRATWERRVATGRVPSYVNEFGRRMVWVEEEPSLGLLYREMRELNAEVQEVLARLEALGCDVESARQEVAADEGQPPKLRLVA